MSKRVRTFLTIGAAVICLSGILSPYSRFVSSRFPEFKLLLAFILVVCVYFGIRAINSKRTSGITDRRDTQPSGEEDVGELHQTAYFDMETGLPNRDLAINRLAHELTRAKRERTKVAIILIDTNPSTEVNDSDGLENNDQILKAVAFRLTRCLRESDIVARMNGNRFTVILPDINNEIDVEASVRRIMNGFAEPFMIGSRELNLTASIGISLFPGDGTFPKQLLRNAEEGALRAREEGSGSYQFFSRETGANIDHRRKIQASLCNAIDRGEMLVYYQPQIELFRRTVAGVEALVRWQHPEYGLIGPEKFIPVAEEMGVIGKIDEWVLRTACTQLKTWLDAGFPPMHVSLNVSSHNFLQPDFLEMIASVLTDTRLSPDQLALEITELTAMRNIEQTCEILETLNNLGVRISIDNFGTGYSSLYFLKRFPVQTLKIDSGFVQDITFNSDSAIIVKAIISMARSMKRKVVAVGVETPEQLDFLRSQHCDAVQGDIFGAPLPAEEFQLLLEQQVWDNSILSIH